MNHVALTLLLGAGALTLGVALAGRARDLRATFVVLALAVLPATAIAALAWTGAGGFGVFHSIDVSPAPISGGVS